MKGQGGISADDVEGVRVFAVAVAICSSGVERAGGVDNAGGVVQNAVAVAAIGGVGVKDAVAVAAATIDSGIGIGGAGVVDNAGVGEGSDDEGDDDDGDGDSNGDGAKLAVGAADAGIVRDPIAAVPVVRMRIRHVGGFGLSLANVKGVC